MAAWGCKFYLLVLKVSLTSEQSELCYFCETSFGAYSH